MKADADATPRRRRSKAVAVDVAPTPELQQREHHAAGADEDQCARIAGIVRDSGWSAKPPAAPDTSAVRVDISYRLADSRGEIVTSDAEQGVGQLIAALDELAAKRFEPALDRLPEAGQQKRR